MRGQWLSASTRTPIHRTTRGSTPRRDLTRPRFRSPNRPRRTACIGPACRRVPALDETLATEARYRASAAGIYGAALFEKFGRDTTASHPHLQVRAHECALVLASGCAPSQQTPNTAATRLYAPVVHHRPPAERYHRGNYFPQRLSRRVKTAASAVSPPRLSPSSVLRRSASSAARFAQCLREN